MLSTIAQATFEVSSSDKVSSSMVALVFLGIFIIALPIIIGTWKTYKKAGKPGWASIVPIYNNWVLFEITKFPPWLALLGIIPWVNLIPAVVSLFAYYRLAKMFGKSDVFSVLTAVFPFICLPILGFGNAQFQGADSPNASAPFESPKSEELAESTASTEEPKKDETPTPPATPAV